jgi:uncharacterized membrane protein
MNSLPTWAFSWICGQDVAHTWAPGGDLLPMCQRCTGFYVGAAIALILMVWSRPQVDSHYRWLHIILVLAMAPFGFHLISHGAVVRTISGQWFGFGVVGLLWLLPGQSFFGRIGRARAGNRLHLVLGLMSLILVPAFACWGGTWAAEILPWLALLGLAAFVGLLTTDIVLFFSWLLGSLSKRVGRQTT